MERVYLDHLTISPPLPEVALAMTQCAAEGTGSPDSFHREGLRARKIWETAREKTARFIGARSPEEVLFTASPTEALNLALLGAVRASGNLRRHVIVGATEHPSLLASALQLAEEGVEISTLPVDSRGFVNPEELRGLLKAETVLVAVHHANHDTGAIQPVESITAIMADHPAALLVDATASNGWAETNVERLGATLMALSPAKFHGPAGLGILYGRRGIALRNVIHQGQARHIFPDNTAAAAGLSALLDIWAYQGEGWRAKLRSLQTGLWRRLSTESEGLHLHGPEPGSMRLPHNLNFSVERLEGEGVALAMDLKGYAIGSGAACTGPSQAMPHTLAAMGVPKHLGKRNLLTGLGANTREGLVDAFAETLAGVIRRQRNLLG